MQVYLKKMFNFKVLIALVSMVLVFTYLSFSASVVKVNKSGYSTVSQNVHASTSTKAKKLGSLKKNQVVYIYAHKGSWSQIKYGNTKGWVAKKNLKVGSPLVTINKDGHATATQYIYASQSTSSKRLATVKKNQNVYVLASQSGWYKVKFGNATGWVVAKNVKLGKYVAPTVTINKDGHAMSNQYIYASQSTKSKRIATVKKNQNVYVIASKSSWYKVKFGKTIGWVAKKNFKLGKYVSVPSAGKTYPDGWTAPILKSAWSSDVSQNYKTLENELGFENGGRTYGVKGRSQTIHVTAESSSNPTEVNLLFYMWEDSNIPESYRIPIVAMELFKLYFGADATRVWNYCNNNDIPESFTANGRNVKVTFSQETGGLNFEVGRKK